MAHEDWGEGPWNNEEDHAVWVDLVTDLDCMINRGSSGALCGYVGVGPDHPYYGWSYDGVDTVGVHGGLTYSAPCQEGDEICHTPAPGREHDIWWFGFDCAHAFDLAPRLEAELAKLRPKLISRPEWSKTYKNWAYVTREVTTLAWQLAQVRDDQDT